MAVSIGGGAALNYAAMRVAFYAPDGAGDKLLVAAVQAGAARHGDAVIYIQTHRYEGVLADADAAACYGVRASSRIILDAYRRAGKRVLFFDKGWPRGIYTRVAVDAWQPTAYFRRGRSSDRLDRSGIVLKPWRSAAAGSKIIFAATTQTWLDFFDLGPGRALYELMVGMLAGMEPGLVVYRPRPAYAKKHPELCGPIAGAQMSDPAQPLAEALNDAMLLVTIGSNAAIEALIHGVPVLVLGDNPARLLNWRTTNVEAERPGFFADLAWTQWTMDEYLSGEAWAEIRQTMKRRGACV